MDERIKSEFRKIYAELLTVVTLLLAASVICKTVFLKLPFEHSLTEFLILIFMPIYLSIRQNMLGLDPNETVPKKQRLFSFFTAFGTAGLIYAASTVYRFGGVNAKSVFSILCFLLGFSLIFFAGRALTHYNAKKKAKQYED